MKARSYKIVAQDRGEVDHARLTTDAGIFQQVRGSPKLLSTVLTTAPFTMDPNYSME